MSKPEELKSLIVTRRLHIPIIRNELFNAILTQLDKVFPPININRWWFNQDAWEGYDKDSYMDFRLLPEYFYIRSKTNTSTELKEFERLQAEVKKNPDKLVKKLPELLDNSFPFIIHVIILKHDEKGCNIEIEYYPFLYFNILLYKNKINLVNKQHAKDSFDRYLKHFEVGLNSTEIEKGKSNLLEYTSFLGIDSNWMACTCALQLQEVAVTIVAKKKGIELNKKNVNQIAKDAQPSDTAFKKKYEAFSKEVKRRYGIDMPQLIPSLRDVRTEILHKGYNPDNDEKESITLFTTSLLDKLRTVYEAN